jgi:hypothetical protein
MTKKSSWDKLKEKSTYHFDNTIVDKKKDVIVELGHIDGDFSREVKKIIKESKAANWETRGFKGEGVEVPSPELKDEEYDLARVGVDPKVVITNLAWKLPKKLQAISDMFAFEDTMNRIHVQQPGQLWHQHIDKLYKWFPEDPSKVMRVFIQLTNWEMGQYWQYGTYNWSHWQAGNVTTFDWQNVPHSTANAGFHPRVTLQITGIATDKTRAFLKLLKAKNVSVV